MSKTWQLPGFSCDLKIKYQTVTTLCRGSEHAYFDSFIMKAIEKNIF